MSEEIQNRLHVNLKGRVQGVGFRYYVQRTASALRITGWVRNRWDGSVEMVAEGPRPLLDQLLAAVRRGPTGAYVSDVQVNWEPARGEFEHFGVRHTA